MAEYSIACLVHFNAMQMPSSGVATAGHHAQHGKRRLRPHQAASANAVQQNRLESTRRRNENAVMSSTSRRAKIANRSVPRGAEFSILTMN
jgi:hypothetical protein